MMRNVLNRLLSIMVMVSVAGWVQGCGRSELKWLRGSQVSSEAMSGAFKGIRQKVQDAVNQGTPPPSVSTYDPNCYANEVTGRPLRNLFWTLSLMELIEGNHTEEELNEMIFSIPRNMTIVDGGQKVTVDLHYMVSAADYWLVLDVVGADRIESEDAKKIFYILGIPFLPGTHEALLSVGRLISMDLDAYVANWFNSRRYLEQALGDLYQRLMAEILPRADLEAWLTSLGFLRDEIDFILNRDIFNPDALPPSPLFNTEYVGPDCAERLPGLPWMAPGVGSGSAGDIGGRGGISGKDPDEIRNRFFERRLEFFITWIGYYCPSPTPSPTPPVLDWVYKPCPSPTPGDGTGKGGDVFVSPSPTPQDFVCTSAPPTAILLTPCQILRELNLPTDRSLPAVLSMLPGYGCPENSNDACFSGSLPDAGAITLQPTGALTLSNGNPVPTTWSYGSSTYTSHILYKKRSDPMSAENWRALVVYCGRFYFLPGGLPAETGLTTNQALRNPSSTCP